MSCESSVSDVSYQIDFRITHIDAKVLLLIFCFDAEEGTLRRASGH